MKMIFEGEGLGNMQEPNPDKLIDREKYEFLLREYQQSNLIPYKGSYLLLEPSAKLSIYGKLRINTNCFEENGRVTNLRMDEASQLIVHGTFDIFYGGDIICFAGSELELGSGFCNSNLILRCTKKIIIGEDVAISHNVTIMDSDAHEILGNNHAKTLPVRIGNHVWIGSGAKILKGVTIGDGAVIGAGAVVTGNVPDSSMAAGIPARIIREKVVWEV